MALRSGKAFSPSLSLSFFQPLLPGFLTNFSIPRNFRQHFGNGISELDKSDILVELKNNYSCWNCSRSGETEDEEKEKTWRVRIDVSDNWRFKDGWEQFGHEHHLCIGYFIVFRLVDSFVFEVSVFDPVSACRISYPSSPSIPNHVMKSFLKEEGEENNFHPTAKVKKENAEEGDEENVVTGQLREKGKQGKVQCANKSKQRNTHPTRKRKQGIMSLPEECNLPRNKKAAFESSGNPYFHTTVKRYCFRWPGMLIPMDFARLHNLSRRWCDLILIDERKKQWPINLRHRKSGKDQAYLSAGWDQFQAANELKNGDSVVFELISSGKSPLMKFYKLS